ncbi:MAG TPA: GGDEF domain-containing protein [Thermoleophilia bacterium]|nr:GGDEF domain-containing protein [Thermoleophilia bacterium]
MEITSRTVDHNALLDLILESSPMGITVLTTDLRYVLVNRYAREELLKLPDEETLGKHCYDLFGMYANDAARSGLERACDACPALRALSTGKPAANVRRVREGLVVQVTSVPLTDDTGDYIGVMEMTENIADKVIDPLTGVHNFRFYDEMMTQEGYRAQRYDTTLALIALDLNNFKLVNDRYGHLRGDEVLREVAATLLRTVRNSDLLCRIGGDEFAVLAPHTTYHEAEALARRIEQSVDGEFHVLGVSISSGIAGYPRDTLNPAELRAIADRRLYEIKDRHRG